MFTLFRSLLTVLLPIIWLITAPVTATTIDPLLPEELVLGADLVGIVECEQAGGIVAKYKVIESWKGPVPGTSVSIRVAVNYYGPQFPITLCGERYFVTAYKQAPSRVLMTSSGGGVPLWWRDLPSDYSLPLFQGRARIGAEGEEAEEADRLRKLSQTLLKAGPAEQELTLLKKLIAKNLFGKELMGGETDEQKARELENRLSQGASAGALVDELLRLAKEDPEKWAIRVRYTFRDSAGEAVLERLEKVAIKDSPWNENELRNLVQEIKVRRGKADAATMRTGRKPKDEKAPDARKLEELRAALASGERSRALGEAFEVLPKHDPGALANYLVNWRNPNKEWRDKHQGYVLGSYFAWKCGGDRKKHLTTLLTATDEFIRVAGAVYLHFEDAEAGTKALVELTKLDGDPGVWAALTLARRGNKDVVPRALMVFKPLGKEIEGGMARTPHYNLRDRVLVLLSNSANAAGAPQPVLPSEEASQWEYLTNWWQTHSARLALVDPWMAELEKQKVD